MPWNNVPKDKWPMMERIVSALKRHGMDEKRSNAIAYSKVMNKAIISQGIGQSSIPAIGTRVRKPQFPKLPGLRNKSLPSGFSGTRRLTMKTSRPTAVSSRSASSVRSPRKTGVFRSPALNNNSTMGFGMKGFTSMRKLDEALDLITEWKNDLNKAWSQAARQAAAASRKKSSTDRTIMRSKGRTNPVAESVSSSGQEADYQHNEPKRFQVRMIGGKDKYGFPLKERSTQITLPPEKSKSVRMRGKWIYTDNVKLEPHERPIDYGHIHSLLKEKYGDEKGNKYYEDMGNKNSKLLFVVGTKIQKEKRAMRDALGMRHPKDAFEMLNAGPQHHYQALHSAWKAKKGIK